MLINPMSDLDEQNQYLSQPSKEVEKNEMEVQFDSDSEKSTKKPSHIGQPVAEEKIKNLDKTLIQQLQVLDPTRSEQAVSPIL